MAVTIKEVAKAAGVAPSTVSRVLKDNPSISRETKEKVQAVMKRLGYVPNVAAQNLVNRRSNIYAVIMPPFKRKEASSEPFFIDILMAISQEALKYNKTISVVAGSNSEELLATVQLMNRQKRVDAFIMLYSSEKDPVIDYLYQEKVVFTIVGRPVERANEISYVDNDNVLLGQTATEYLIEKGHRDIAFVTNHESNHISKSRYNGYAIATMQRGLLTHGEFLLVNSMDYIEFIKKLESNQITAIFAIDDLFAIRLVQLLAYNGLHVPDDVSVISTNNSAIATTIHPYLTSIDIDVNELGKSAIQLILQQEENETKIPKLIISHQIIERESVKKRN
ncbi:MAG: LacI family transcriptional regulator [Streptococcaceae bacterium]|nr:LacI family transcriptional regulator [Streptococcaceae bacterium]